MQKVKGHWVLPADKARLKSLLKCRRMETWGCQDAHLGG